MKNQEAKDKFVDATDNKSTSRSKKLTIALLIAGVAALGTYMMQPTKEPIVQ